MQASLLLDLGQIRHNLVIGILLFLELLLHALLVQVSDLELAHKLIHSISIEKLLVTHYADLASALLPRFYLLRLDRRSIRLNRVRPLFVEAFIATEFSTEMAVFQLPLL